MFADYKTDVKLSLEGKRIKSFLLLAGRFLSFLLFVFYCFSVIYLFVWNTSFFKSLGIYKNNYILGAACASAVIIGAALFLFFIWVKFISLSWFAAVQDENFSPVKMNFSRILKITGMYFNVFFRKALNYVLFLIPFFLYSAGIYLLNDNEMPEKVFYILASGEWIIFFISAAAAYIYNLRYSLINSRLYYETDKRGDLLIKSSIYMMNGKLVKLFLMKISLLPLKILSLLIVPGIFFLPFCKAAEEIYISDRKKPYLPKRKAHTEKTMVFYFGRKAYEG